MVSCAPRNSTSSARASAGLAGGAFVEHRRGHAGERRTGPARRHRRPTAPPGSPAPAALRGSRAATPQAVGQGEASAPPAASAPAPGPGAAASSDRAPGRQRQRAQATASTATAQILRRFELVSVTEPANHLDSPGRTIISTRRSLGRNRRHDRRDVVGVNRAIAGQVLGEEVGHAGIGVIRVQLVGLAAEAADALGLAQERRLDLVQRPLQLARLGRRPASRAISSSITCCGSSTVLPGRAVACSRTRCRAPATPGRRRRPGRSAGRRPAACRAASSCRR